MTDSTPAFLDGAGEMARAIRRHDWQGTLGAPAQWPAPLATLVGLMLASEQPMFMAWGARQTWLYNDAFIPILGRKHPAALGRPALDVWSEAREDLAPLFDQVFQGQPVHMRDIVLGLDRRGQIEEAHFAFSYTPVRDTDGAVRGLFGACIETTDQVLAARRSAEARARERRLFEQAPGFIAILNGPRHVIEFANAAYVRLTGGRALMGRSVREAFPELQTQGFHELLDEVYRSGKRYVASQVAVRLAAPQGGQAVEHRLDFIYEPMLDEAGRVTGIFVEGHDVTEAHRAQQRLRDTERRQALLIELGDRFRGLDEPADLSYAAAELLGQALGVSRAGYGTVDIASETITIERDWNAPGIRSLAGTLRFRDYGSYIEDLKRGDTVVFADATVDPRTRDRADALAAISALSVVNMPVTEYEGLVALLYLNNATPRPWTAEELSLIRDVAERTRSAVERRRAEKDLMALTASLEQQVTERTAALRQAEDALRQSQKLEAVGQLTGGVAHDFNNLLAVVSNNVYLHRRLSPACEHSKQLAAVVRATETGARLTRHLLTFARRQAILPEVIRLQDELRDLAAVLKVTVGGRIDVDVQVQPDTPPTRVDRAELELALLNLAVNARDAMPEGGLLSVHASPCVNSGSNSGSNGGVNGGNNGDAPGVCIEVRDSGTGIPPEVLARVLEPFFTTKQPGQGTGLGLSQAYGFATQAGGSLDITSQVGVGTTVKLVLPASSDEAGTGKAPRAPVSERLRARVLLVEDNAEVASTVRDLLSDAGCEVLQAASGAAGRDVLLSPRGAGVQLVLSDLVMPGAFSGLELAQWLERERPGLPILLYSGYSREMAQARELGFTVLQKPVVPEELLDEVQRQLMAGAAGFSAAAVGGTSGSPATGATRPGQAGQPAA